MITSITLKPVLFHICLFLTRVTQKILPLVDIDSGLAVGHIPIDDRSPGQQMLAFKIRCVMLKMKSNEAYVHLRANGLLPLPSLSTIRRILSSSECKFGFNTLQLGSIPPANIWFIRGQM